MPAMSAIQQLVEKFAKDLEAAIRAEVYASIRASIGGQSGPAAPKRGPGRPPKSATSVTSAPQAKPAVSRSTAPSTSKRRSANEIESDAGRIVVAVKAKPGSTAEQLKMATKIMGTDFALPIKKLLEERRIRKTGEKRSTKYFPV